MRVEVLRSTPDPEELVWLCAHQCYTAGFAADDKVPADPGAAIVKHLLLRGHYGPFEHPQISFNIGGISRACLAQLTRHRIGITFDVQSHRYTQVGQPDEPGRIDTRDLFVYPPYLSDAVEDINKIHHARGYGKVELTDEQESAKVFAQAYGNAFISYQRLLELGVPAEDARMVLPEGTLVNLTMSANARSLMHILDMRMPPNAQWEIRLLCDKLLDLAEEWMPATFAWYRENRAGKHKLAP